MFLMIVQPAPFAKPHSMAELLEKILLEAKECVKFLSKGE